MRILVAALLAVAALSSNAFATQWSSMFQSSNHDFGTVARAAKTEHRFYFDNPFAQPIQFLNYLFLESQEVFLL